MFTKPHAFSKSSLFLNLNSPIPFRISNGSGYHLDFITILFLSLLSDGFEGGFPALDESELLASDVPFSESVVFGTEVFDYDSDCLDLSWSSDVGLTLGVASFSSVLVSSFPSVFASSSNLDWWTWSKLLYLALTKSDDEANNDKKRHMITNDDKLLIQGRLIFTFERFTERYFLNTSPIHLCSLHY